MRYYYYNPITKIFTGEGESDAVPEFATTLEPDYGDGSCNVVFLVEENKWTLVPLEEIY